MKNLVEKIFLHKKPKQNPGDRNPQESTAKPIHEELKRLINKEGEVKVTDEELLAFGQLTEEQKKEYLEQKFGKK